MTLSPSLIALSRRTALLSIGALGLSSSCAADQDAASRRTEGLRMASPRATHVALDSPHGVLMIGGFAREGAGLRSVEKFDVRAGTFKPFGDMATGRIQPLAHALPDGRILVMGGEWGAQKSSAEIGGPDGRFRTLGSMLGRRTAAASAALGDGQILICGGSTRDGRMLDSAEIFDPRTSLFRSTSRMIRARAGHTATTLSDGRILVVGGGLEDQVIADAEIFDPATGRFRATAPLSVARYKHGAVLLQDGAVMVVGGSDNRSGGDRRGRLTSCEVYDSRSESFRSGPRLADARYKLSPSTVARRDGAIIVASGGSSPEILRPGATRFSSLDVRYDTRRDYMAASPIGTGEILVTGGYDAAIEATAQAWIIPA